MDSMFQIVSSSFTPLTQVYTLGWKEVAQNQFSPQSLNNGEMRRGKGGRPYPEEDLEDCNKPPAHTFF